ncbi:interleukin-10 receptor subunit beta [Centropristis striata]|uniref:interleukin-10 receptor subunit beta n=1 Tax=Centropristis striata TaxID=184440 RepID=UPI0027E0AD32|nr:interleukin-10 receptor subunit beta [Centropristis striata]
MAAAFFILLSFCFLRIYAVDVVAPPENLTMITMNTNYTLHWDWDRSSAEGHAVTFTTQYVARFKLKSKKKSPNWSTVCEKTSQRSCDLTRVNLFYSGIFMLRVQANVDGRQSDWVLKEFCPDRDAAVGPPSKVDLSPAGSDLDVILVDPLTSTNISMRVDVPDLSYHILYWERSEDAQTPEIQTLASRVNVVTLPHLKAWTWYCVRVQSLCGPNKSSNFTSAHCMQTEGPIPWWQVFLYFLGSLMICFLVVLFVVCCSYWCCKTVKATFYPSIKLPAHFQYLCDSSGSDIPRLLTPDSHSALLCDKVTVCPEPPAIEIHSPPDTLPALPLDLEPDSSGRHSRQDSGSSGDSGVYSTGGSANLQQPNSSQSSAGAQDSGQGPFKLEQVKMQDISMSCMASVLKTQPVVADEGIVDLCV